MRSPSIFATLVLTIVTATNSRAEPLVVFQTKPINELITIGNTTNRSVSQLMAKLNADDKRASPNLAQAIIDFFAQNLTDDWDKTIDATRPILGYVEYHIDAPEFSPAHLLIPMKGTPEQIKRFLDRVATVGDEEDGIFPITLGGNWRTHGRIANKTLYLALSNLESFKVAPLEDPTKLIAPLGDQVLAFRAYPSRLPPVLKQIIQFAWDGAMEQAMRQADNDPLSLLPKAVKELQKQWIRRFMGAMLDIVKEGDVVSLGLLLEPKTNELGFEIQLSARNGTALAKSLTDTPRYASSIAGIAEGNPAAQLMFNLPIPNEIARVFEESIKSGFEEQNAPTDEERAEFEKTLKAVRPTLRSGYLQIGAGLHRSKKGYTTVGGIALKNGSALEKMFRDSKPSEGLFTLDVDRAEGFAIHSFSPPDGSLDSAEALFGDEPILFAFRKDAIMFAYGFDAKSQLVKALKSPARTSSQVEIGTSIRELLPLLKMQDGANSKLFDTLIGLGIDKMSILKIDWQGGKTLRFRATTDAWQLFLALGIGYRSEQID